MPETKRGANWSPPRVCGTYVIEPRGVQRRNGKDKLDGEPLSRAEQLLAVRKEASMQLYRLTT